MAHIHHTAWVYDVNSDCEVVGLPDMSIYVGVGVMTMCLVPFTKKKMTIHRDSKICRRNTHM